jgi:predicted nucleic acid-binding protein
LREKRLLLDTTICIDLFNGDLLTTVIRLPYECALPDVIVAELVAPPGELFAQSGYAILSIQADRIPEFTTLRKKYPKPSTNDLFALVLSKTHSCILITGDSDLRNAAKSEGVSAHGLLWILDELVDRGILGSKDAATALEQILSGGSWLPKKDCEVRLKKWKTDKI